MSWLLASPIRRPGVGRRLSLEALEDRLVPAPFGFSVQSTGFFSNDALFSLDLVSSFRTQIGSTTGSQSITGLAFDPTSGVLYGIDQNLDRLVAINTTTGVGTTVGALGINVNGVGLTADAAGNLFMTNDSNNNFYSVNKTTGAATLIGSTGFGVTALASVQNGVLYGLTHSPNARLVTVNLSTGALTPIGSLGLFGFTDAGVDFDSSGVLRGITDSGQIFTVNLTTGAATVVVNGVFGFESLAIPGSAPPAPPVPPPPPPPMQTFSIGTNPNTQSFVKIYGPDLNERFILNPFPGFSGSIRAAAGDVNGDGFVDSIVSVAEGPPHVKVFDGVSGTEMISFFAFDPRFLGGVNVSAGDVDGDGTDEVIVGAASGFSHVIVFGVPNGPRVVASFFAFPGYSGGVTVGGGDVNGDGFGDVLVGTARQASHVKAFSGQGLGLLASFLATDSFTLGVEVTAGDFDGDGRAEIVAALSGSALVEIIDARTSALLTAFTPYPGYNSRIGVDAFDVDGNGDDELLLVTLSGTAHALLNDPFSGALLSSFVAFPSARQPVPR